MKDKKLIPYTIYGLGVCIFLCVAAISDLTPVIVTSSLVAAFFAYRLYQCR